MSARTHLVSVSVLRWLGLGCTPPHCLPRAFVQVHMSVPQYSGNIGALMIRRAFWGYYTILTIRSPDDSIGDY